MTAKNTIDVVRQKLKNGVMENDCIVWPYGKDEHGYGTIQYNGRGWKVHRLQYYLMVGDIPNGMVIMHMCDNPPCYNINHLKLGTVKDNVRDMARKDRHGQIKLSKEIVKIIVERFKSGEKGRDLAKEYNCSPSTISRYVNKRRRYE